MEKRPQSMEEAWTELGQAVRGAIEPAATRLDDWLTPARLVAAVAACFVPFVVLGIVYGHPEVVLLPIAVWFAVRLLRS